MKKHTQTVFSLLARPSAIKSLTIEGKTLSITTR
jgi:hypothetical protein